MPIKPHSFLRNKPPANSFSRVLVTGGAGYVGSVLVPKLLAAGYGVTVLDLYLYGDDVFDGVRGHAGLREIKGDLRDPAAVASAPSKDATRSSISPASRTIRRSSWISTWKIDQLRLFPALGPRLEGRRRQAFRLCLVVQRLWHQGWRRHRGYALRPADGLLPFKALCEQVLAEERAPGFVTLTLRPATVCGYGPRQRLDVIVNILTNHAVNTAKVKVFGGAQLRPNLHIEDMTDLYLLTLRLPDGQIDGKVFNAGYENHSVMDLAGMVRRVVGDHVGIEVVPTDDLRSYHISSEPGSSAKTSASCRPADDRGRRSEGSARSVRGRQGAQPLR